MRLVYNTGHTMSKAKKLAKPIDIWKKKRWHTILAPKLFNNQVIGESPALEPNMMLGRTVMANLMHLTRDMKNQHVDLTFEVEKIQGDTAYTQLKTYEVNPAYIKRFVRRNRDRIDDSFICKSSDGVLVQLKPFLLTRSLTTKSIATKMRNITRRYLAHYVSQNDYESIARDIVNYRVQRTLVDYVKHLYPLKACEIRVMGLVKGEIKNVVKPSSIDDLTPPSNERQQQRRRPREMREIKAGVQETEHALPMNVKRKVQVEGKEDLTEEKEKEAEVKQEG